MMPAGMTVMLAVEPVNLGRSFDGLAALVGQRFAKDPRAERMLFVFVNRRRTAAKVLWGDPKGWFILARRLDKDVVDLPQGIPAGARCVTVDARVLASLLEGSPPRRRETRREVVHAARAAMEKACATTRNTQLPTTTADDQR